MNKLFIASNNKHKIEEIKDILNRNNVEIDLVCPRDFNHNEEPEEDGKTFKENAYIKAKYYHDLFNLPTIADDSGICIDYLGGLPGVHSARFMPDLNYDETMDFVINLMKDVKNRNAQFVDCMCFIDKDNNVSFYEGINEGYIAYKKAGKEGFGYDPIFVIPEFNKTEAELGAEYKNQYSHRAKALKKWIIDAKEKL